ncbi:ChrR family anti-sigma-E factor [Variovorax sp. J2P1-59]|uniref:ChrR family anti-sigma-E factor n=1 Tax=Variovorax flavidus TaxID=3053501 RepID=UPI0025775479|nr:ChrR family anti-sigma-E factor [Variovorax sp. J2P1-59]MDM0074989.1 ChrR family anti-sigma-E factor [Variovorax sp. J2P1-59]
MILHHPAEDLLLAFAAGRLSNGHSLVVASHVEGCAHCRERVRLFEAMGGAMLEELAPEVLESQALAKTLAAIDAPASAVTRPRAGSAMRAELPDGLPWPHALQGCASTRWRWLGPGMRWSRVTLPGDDAANVFLLRIGAGKMLPQHTHSDSELTQVLYGTFHDGRALFGPGDFDETDGSIRHQPTVEAAGECICLASVQGKVLFDGAVARVLGALVGM